MSVPDWPVTRGHGLLEGFLARQRARRANSLIPAVLRTGRILDLGCGSYPTFLLNTKFAERYGVDRVTLPTLNVQNLKLIAHDVSDRSPLPFRDDFFDVVTMLAVFEHLESGPLSSLLIEIRRVLRPGGIYVMTTPLRWTEGILKAMSRLGLVSHEEIGEHEAQYTSNDVAALLAVAGFHSSLIRRGTFELGVNLWAVAQKES